MMNVINWQPAHLADTLVRLEPLVATDFERLFAAASDPLIWEQHPEKTRYQRDVFQKFFDGALESKTAFVIIEQSSSDVIGSSRYYDFKPDDASIAIGWTFLIRRCWGGTFNRSVKRLMIDYAFEHVGRVMFHIGSENKRSQLATMKFGATKISETYLGETTLHYEYALEKRVWETLRSA
jgi:RimJ/RimL family protein N-acetyltransferase